MKKFLQKAYVWLKKSLLTNLALVPLFFYTWINGQEMWAGAFAALFVSTNFTYIKKAIAEKLEPSKSEK